MLYKTPLCVVFTGLTSALFTRDYRSFRSPCLKTILQNSVESSEDFKVSSRNIILYRNDTGSCRVYFLVPDLLIFFSVSILNYWQCFIVKGWQQENACEKLSVSADESSANYQYHVS